MEIKVLGPGCPRCEATEKNVKEAVVEAGVDAKVEKVAGAMEIAKHGVFGTPAVVVDGEVSVNRGHQIGHDVKNALLAEDLRILDVAVHIEPSGLGLSDPGRSLEQR